MKLLSFVKALLPRIEKNTVIEDMRITIAELENIVLASYTTAADHFKLNKFKSKILIELNNDFFRNFSSGGVKQPNYIAEINKALSNVKLNAVYIESLLEELFERDIINEGLSAKKAILLRSASNLSFISRYMVDLLNYTYVVEAAEISGTKPELSKATLKHIKSNFSKFARLYSDFAMDNKRYESLIGKIPEVILSSKNENALKGMFTDKDMDPFESRHLQGFTASPIYHLRLTIAEWQASRYKANKDKKKVLELRLLHLSLLMDDKKDAKLEKEIDYVQNRVDKISRYLQEVEESLED